MKRALFVSLHVSLLLIFAADLAAQALRRKPVFSLGVARRLQVGPEDVAQLEFDTSNPNLVDNRGLFGPGGMAVDATASPAILYVADSNNHRVLAWRNPASFANGAPADLVLGQREPAFTAVPGGPATGFSAGLTFPTGLAVDRNGNLYIADCGNNRVLRFPRPFSQPADSILPDMVIGQASFSAAGANTGGISERTLFLNINDPLLGRRAGLAFDPQGNLFVTDTGNHRVLRYSANDLAEGRNQPRANFVLGQMDFTSNSPATSADDKAKLDRPVAVMVDAAGRIYVGDRARATSTSAQGRVLFFEATATQANGAEATRLLGRPPRQQPGQPALPAVNEFTLNTAEGLALTDNRLLVTDTAAHRALLYDPADQWPAETANQPSPPARVVLGQADLRSFRPYAGRDIPHENGLFAPTAVLSFNSELFLADTGSNRVLVFPQVTGGFSPARRVLGQLGFDTEAPNLLEGREFNTPNGVAIDRSVSPPRLYVADTLNHRILGFRSLQALRTGAAADLVIGQTDMLRNLINSPTNKVETPTDTGLFRPSGLAVDAAGNLWVADLGNGRVLRFPAPFARAGQTQRADLVLGQPNFTTRLEAPNSRTMSLPWGLAFTADGADPAKAEGGLAVSDPGYHRVLYFRKPFANGMAAEKVVGQPDFTTVSVGVAGTNRFNEPLGIAFDAEDRLYVADSRFNRVQIFERIQNIQGVVAPLATITGISLPAGVTISSRTGVVWIAESNGQRILRYPRFEDAQEIGFNADSAVSANRPIGVALDGFDNLLVTDSVHRVSLFAPGLRFTNGASFAEGALAPGTISSVFPVSGVRCGPRDCVAVNFGSATRVFNELPEPIPMPVELAGIQLTIDDRPAPLYFVSPGQINFLLPMRLPNSGTVQVMVRNASTGQLFGASDLGLRGTSPGLFAANGSGAGTLAALNQDSTIHTPVNPIAPGEVIVLFGTGQGFVPDAPPDGTLAEGLLSTPSRPRVTLGGRAVPDDHILYSGLAPGLLGVWQVNVRIPADAPLGNSILLRVSLNDVFSQDRATIAIRNR
jgi:uncharacterized protein (TIGR03437 family)